MTPISCLILIFIIGCIVYYEHTNKLSVKIFYHTDIDEIKMTDDGNWIDLRAAEDIELKKDEFKLISLGVSMKLPNGYEAHILPRSSTLKNFGIIMGNSEGIVDNNYSGQNDIYKFPALAVRDTSIKKNDRICQMKLEKIQKRVVFEKVSSLSGSDRGGFGSTGTN